MQLITDFFKRIETIEKKSQQKDYFLMKGLYKHYNSMPNKEAAASQCTCVWELFSQCKYFTLYG